MNLEEFKEINYSKKCYQVTVVMKETFRKITGVLIGREIDTTPFSNRELEMRLITSHGPDNIIISKVLSSDIDCDNIQVEPFEYDINLIDIFYLYELCRGDYPDWETRDAGIVVDKLTKTAYIGYKKIHLGILQFLSEDPYGEECFGENWIYGSLIEDGMVFSLTNTRLEGLMEYDVLSQIDTDIPIILLSKTKNKNMIKIFKKI